MRDVFARQVQDVMAKTTGASVAKEPRDSGARRLSLPQRTSQTPGFHTPLYGDLSPPVLGNLSKFMYNVQSPNQCGQAS